MGRIPDQIVEQVKDAADIVDVVGKHVQLKRSGSEFSGLCPFHDERTPSFGVNPSKQAYYCFGCGAGGSVLRFVMDFHNLPFPEAVQQLAGQYGIEIVEEEYDPKADAARKLRSQLLMANRDAANWFHRLLMRHPCAAGAREYLRSRQITSDVAKRWGLGYAPDGDSLSQWGASKGHAPDIMAKAGLAGFRDENRPHLGIYPRFRDRLMFPICDDNGQPVAFSGRLLDPAAKTAKYLNSPETPIFDKGRILFGLHLSKRPILKAKTAIVCEGQIDLISCFEAGVENVVAQLGTGFTSNHAKILKRHADEVILLNDSDAAGYKANVRAFGTLAGAGIQVRAGILPEGEDPDSLIRKSGADALRPILDAALEFHDFQLERRSAELDLTTVRGRVQLAKEIAATAAHHGDKATQDAVITHVSTRLRMASDEFRTLVAEADREIQRDRKFTRIRESKVAARDEVRAARLASRQPPRPGEPPVTPEVIEVTDFSNPAIALLCRLALTKSDVQRYLRANLERVPIDQFPGGRVLRRLVEDAPDPESEGEGREQFLSTLAAADERGLRAILESSAPQGGVDVATQALNNLEVRFLQSELARVKAMLDDPQTPAADQAGLMAQHMELTRSRQAARQRQLEDPASRT